ncbi:ATP-binding cassette domain-containing protein [Lachnospiraceae bacterium]|jgi:ABC-type uncharacterized transport system ATPase subunit|nr:ATP-binding cassette domain-containing protein [uncultured Schaedlerella sp.]MCI9153511.1 ATP-binding cassette domain-containing protein [Ruminococcus sp.]NBI57260.1 ATP-binding cassette domain-containing protein [Lachnospiraceae bacterium]
MSEIMIETRNLTKIFGNLTACDNINLKFESGKIHAIAGENGAGKSTLMKMLYGVYKRTSGDIIVDGNTVEVWNPSVARESGMGMVFQDFRLIPAFTVLENVFLSDPQSGKYIHKKILCQKIKQLSERYNLHVQPETEVWKLDLGQRQHVEILKVLMGENTRVLIFDEPTSVLAPHEIQAFLDMLLQLKKDNYAIILITHKIKEVIAVADTISVLRQGKLVKDFYRKDGYSEAEIVSSMLNSEDVDLNLEYDRYDEMKQKPQGEELLKVCKITVKDNHNRNIVTESSFSICKGEIIGVAGISGNGQRELAETVFGMRKPSSGQIWFAGKDVSKASIEEHLSMGMRFVTEDPMRDNVIKSFTILEHMALAGLPVKTKGINIDWDSLLEEYNSQPIISKMRVPNPDRYAAWLSGGNLQRMVFARAIATAPSMLIASYPSRGLDVATVKNVHNALLELRKKKAAIMLISEDVSELFSISDRMIVLANNRIYGPYIPEHTTQEKIGKIMLKGDE